MSLLINDQTTGHQSSAAPPHTESVTQDVDGSNHDDSRLDTKATVQGTGVRITTQLHIMISGNVGVVQSLDRKDRKVKKKKAAVTAKTLQMTTERKLRNVFI